MAAIGMASLGTQCANPAIGMASLGVFCGVVVEPPPGVITHTSAGGRSRYYELPDEPSIIDRIMREDMDIIAIVVTAIDAGIIE
jgi:hypothetical protein